MNVTEIEEALIAGVNSDVRPSRLDIYTGDPDWDLDAEPSGERIVEWATTTRVMSAEIGLDGMIDLIYVPLNGDAKYKSTSNVDEAIEFIKLYV